MPFDSSHDVDAIMAKLHPDRYAAPSPERAKSPSVEKAVIEPIVAGKRSARRSERHQAIADATSWIAAMIEYRAELASRLPQLATRPGPARKGSLERVTGRDRRRG